MPKARLVVGTAGSLPTQVIPASMNRVGLILLPGGNGYTAKTDPPVSANDGVLIQATGAPLYLVGPEYEEIVKLAWYVWPASTPLPIPYVEILGP